ncbi:hypothetical protein GCM10023189_56340 [Nibrella saemangeumensis]|uniref:Lipocalin-like domain-containing protein n=1 Tax=Nibrella saemangeumensis TaxID=1084526 RepID=A0ABP8NPS1_9BACT
MKRSLTLFFVLLLAVSACKLRNGGEAADPREQYVGSYAGGYQAVIKIGSSELDPESGNVTINVAKGANPKEISLQMVFGQVTETMTAELNGADFTIIDKKQDRFTVNNTTIEGQYTASGKFVSNNKEIVIQTQAGAIRGGVQYVKSGSITGTRK